MEFKKKSFPLPAIPQMELSLMAQRRLMTRKLLIAQILFMRGMIFMRRMLFLRRMLLSVRILWMAPSLLTASKLLILYKPIQATASLPSLRKSVFFIVAIWELVEYHIAESCLIPLPLLPYPRRFTNMQLLSARATADSQPSFGNVSLNPPSLV
jgi:hypothetical protein